MSTPPPEEDLEEHDGLTLGDLVITTTGDGSNPGIVRRIVGLPFESPTAPQRFFRSFRAIFVEVEEIKGGKTITIFPEHLKQANPLISLAGQAEEGKEGM